MPETEHAPLSDPVAGHVTRFTTPLPPESALAALARAGRRGRLPGFTNLQDNTFRLDCDAIPFEHEIRGVIEAETAPEPSPANAASRVTLSVRRKPLMPTAFAVTLILTVWPGVWLTDSLIATYWATYGRWTESMPWLTYAWYLPLTALPLPWLWKSLTVKSAAMARESALTQLKAVEKELAEAASDDEPRS